MALTLHVDAARWRAHLSATLAANPGLIPVVKGNGYGFGLDLLVAECARLHGSAGVGMIAVGTYAEAPLALAAFPGDVLVMEPYRPVIHDALPHLGDGALVHTITHGPDLDELAGRVGRPRVVVEGLSSMNRHGIPAEWMQPALDALAPCDLLGLSLHLPLGSGHVAEVRRWAHVWTRYPSALANTPVTSSAPQTVHPRGTPRSPRASATTSSPRNAAAISTNVKASASTRGAYRSIRTIWNV